MYMNQEVMQRIDPTLPPPIHTMKAYQLMRQEQRRNGKCGVPDALKKSNFFFARDIFKRYDANKSGTLDKREFLNMMRALDPSRNDFDLVEQIFREQVDLSGSGEVYLHRFLQWTFCGADDAPDFSTMETAAEGEGSQAGEDGRGSKSLNSDERITLRFTYDPSFGIQMGSLIRLLEKLDAPVKVKCCQAKSTRGVTSVIAKIGRGIALWDSDTMMAHFPYPFQTIHSSIDWVTELAKYHVPVLLDVARRD